MSETIRRRRQLLRGRPADPAPGVGGGYSGPFQPNRPSGLTLIIDTPLNDVDAEGITRTFGGGETVMDEAAPFGPACYQQSYPEGHTGGGVGGQLELALPVLTTMYCAVNVKFSDGYVTHYNQEKFLYPIVGPDSNEHPPYPLNIYRRDGDSSGDIGQSYRRSPQGDTRLEEDGVTPVRDQFAFEQTSNAEFITKGVFNHLEILYEGVADVGAPEPQEGPYPARLRCWINNVLVIDDTVTAWWNGTDLGFRLFRLDDTRGGGPDIENGPLTAPQNRRLSGLAIYGLAAA